jgi:hypothetical protein
MAGLVVGCGSSGSGGGNSAATSPPAGCSSPSTKVDFAFPSTGTVTYESSIKVGGANNSNSGSAVMYLNGAQQTATQEGYGGIGATVPLKMGRNVATISVGALCQSVAIVRRRETSADRAAAVKQAAARRAAAAKQAAARRAAAAKRAAARRAAAEVYKRQRAAAAKAQARQRKAQAQERVVAAAAAKQNFIDTAQSIPYADLIKGTGPYLGNKILLEGQILQIQQDDSGGGIMLLSVTDEGDGIWTDNVWIDYSTSVPYVENDIINVCGTVTGTKTYTTQEGGQTYVPEVRAKYIEDS